MKLNLIEPGGSKASSVDVSDIAFGQEFNQPLVHQVVVAYLAKARAGTRKQKTRSEVRGGGAKPWRQKGTGRARAGTIRSPLWRSGGVTFAARPQNHEQKVNKKMFRGAMRSIFSELVRQERLIVIESISVDEPKTKVLMEKLAALDFKKGLIVTDDLDVNLYLSVRNIPHVDIFDGIESAGSPVDLVGAEKVLITMGALKQVEERLA